MSEWDFKPPAFQHLPEWEYTLGPEVASLCEAVGYAPDPEQRFLLDAAFAVHEDGLAAAYELADIAPRQNQKTGFAKQCALGWLFVTGEQVVTWSAHEFSTSQGAFNDLSAICLGSPVLRKRLEHDRSHGIHGSKGAESIKLANGNELRFRARTKDGTRGLTGDKIILDEAFALADEHMGAMLPTLTAVPDPQILYLSSAGKITSNVLRGVRNRGRAGGDPRLAYAEWCAEKKPCYRMFEGRWIQDLDCKHARPGEPGWHEGCALDDEDLWAQANTLLGRQRSNGTGLTMTKMRNFRRSEPPGEWMRERMGWWDEPGAAAVFGTGNWEACLGVIEPGEALVTVGVAVSIDLSHAAIVGATGSREHPKVRVLQSGPGTDWVLDRLRSLRAEFADAMVVIDPKGPGGSLLRDIEIFDRDAVGQIGPATPSTDNLLDACADLYKAIIERRLVHEDDPELTASVEGVVKRPVRDRWMWGRSQSSTDISPLEAATLAVWGLAEEPPVSAYEAGAVMTV